MSRDGSCLNHKRRSWKRAMITAIVCCKCTEAKTNRRTSHVQLLVHEERARVLRVLDFAKSLLPLAFPAAAMRQCEQPSMDVYVHTNSYLFDCFSPGSTPKFQLLFSSQPFWLFFTAHVTQIDGISQKISGSLCSKHNLEDFRRTIAQAKILSMRGND